VRYPAEAQHALAAAGIRYRGWLPNHRVPEVFARARCTVHVPRRAYTQTLPGIPTIRVFEALACGVPLVCAPWCDAEQLFTPGKDYLLAQSEEEMCAHLRAVLHDRDFAAELAEHGLQTIRAKHTCAHRVDELCKILDELDYEERVCNGKRGRQMHA
jgi:spore maturation protein CgeB